MVRTIDAVFEGGILRPLQSLEGLADRSRVTITIVSPDSANGGIASCVGILPDDQARELKAIINEEFERIDLRDW